MQDTIVTVHGRLVADPEVCVGKSGQPYARFRVASTPRRPVAGQPGAFEDGDTAFYTVYAWRNLGANVVKSFAKGEPVVVHGRLKVREFQREDKSYGTSVTIDANVAGHDLNWGQAVYEKVVKPSYGSGDRMDDAFAAEQESESYADAERDDYLVVNPDTGEVTGSQDPAEVAA